MKIFKFLEAAGWGLKIFGPKYQKTHRYAKYGGINRLAYVAVAVFKRYTAAKKSTRDRTLEIRVVYTMAADTALP